MSGGPDSPGTGGTIAPRNTQSQCSQPLEKPQRPDSRKPPSTRSTLPTGW